MEKRFRSSLFAEGKSFHEMAGSSPCDGCHAWCCRMLLFPHRPPSTFMDLDYLRYLVGFQRVKILVTRDNEWNIVVEDVCQWLDQGTNRCTVHGTDSQPRTCARYNEHDCSYKRQFTVAMAPGSVLIDYDGWESVLDAVRLGEDGALSSPLDYTFLRVLLATDA